MTTSRSDGGTSPAGRPAAQDPIGPRDSAAQQRGGRVEGGGTEGTPPVNLDDDEIYSGRGKDVRTGGTANANGGDSAPLGPPAEQLSDRIGPSDPDRRGPRT